MPRFGRNTAIERLTDLADHHQLVDKAPPERAENFTQGCGRGWSLTGKYC
jgi:hypothetical protein